MRASSRKSRAVGRRWLFEDAVADGVGLALCMVALSCLIGGVFLVMRPDRNGVDSFGSVDSRDPGVICNTYGEGHVVCSEAPPGVKRYREAQRARAARERGKTP
jgi:hypothetical protein